MLLHTCIFSVYRGWVKEETATMVRGDELLMSNLCERGREMRGQRPPQRKQRQIPLRRRRERQRCRPGIFDWQTRVVDPTDALHFDVIVCGDNDPPKAI